MQFTHTWKQVLDGTKTQTRRIWKPEYNTELALIPDYDTGVRRISAILNSGRVQYKLFGEYAIQTGRGKPAIGRILITNIWREDVRQISREDVAAEGFINRFEFFKTWVSMHDKEGLRGLIEDTDFIEMTTDKYLSMRPPERYDAAVIRFELLR